MRVCEKLLWTYVYYYFLYVIVWAGVDFILKFHSYPCYHNIKHNATEKKLVNYCSGKKQKKTMSTQSPLPRTLMANLF